MNTSLTLVLVATASATKLATSVSQGNAPVWYKGLGFTIFNPPPISLTGDIDFATWLPELPHCCLFSTGKNYTGD